jgi:hypothetical protein
MTPISNEHVAGLIVERISNVEKISRIDKRVLVLSILGALEFYGIEAAFFEGKDDEISLPTIKKITPQRVYLNV